MLIPRPTSIPRTRGRGRSRPGPVILRLALLLALACAGVLWLSDAAPTRAYREASGTSAADSELSAIAFFGAGLFVAVGIIALLVILRDRRARRIEPQA